MRKWQHVRESSTKQRTRTLTNAATADRLSLRVNRADATTTGVNNEYPNRLRLWYRGLPNHGGRWHHIRTLHGKGGPVMARFVIRHGFICDTRRDKPLKSGIQVQLARILICVAIQECQRAINEGSK